MNIWSFLQDSQDFKLEKKIQANNNYRPRPSGNLITSTPKIKHNNFERYEDNLELQARLPTCLTELISHLNFLGICSIL